MTSRLSSPTFLGGRSRGGHHNFCPTVREITSKEGQIPSYFPTFPAWGQVGQNFDRCISFSCTFEKSLKAVSFSYVRSSTSLCGFLLVLLDCLRSSTHENDMEAAFMVLLVAFLVTNCITYCLCRAK